MDGWIIESDGLADAGQQWLAIKGVLRWTGNRAEALRFARQSDALSFLSMLCPSPACAVPYEGKADA